MVGMEVMWGWSWCGGDGGGVVWWGWRWCGGDVGGVVGMEVVWWDGGGIVGCG